MRWLTEPAGSGSIRAVTGTFGEFLATSMSAQPTYLRPELPFPREAVIQEFVDQGQIRGGMHTSWEWVAFPVEPSLYEGAKREVVGRGLATRGDDEPWVDSLFFRHALCLAHERGSPVQHEIRRMAELRLAGEIEHGFGHLDDRLQVTLTRFRRRVGAYEFDRPLAVSDRDSHWPRADPPD